MSIIVNLSGAARIPENRVEFVLFDQGGQGWLGIECAKIRDFAKRGDAEISVEIIDLAAFSSKSMHRLGAAAEFADGLRKTVALGRAVSDPRSVQTRLVASNPSSGRILARTERVTPMLRQAMSEDDIAPSDDMEGNFFAVRFMADLRVPFRGSLAYEHPTIEINPGMLSPETLRNDAVMALVVVPSVEKIVHGLLLDDSRTGPGWDRFRDWVVSQSGCASWDEFKESFEEGAAAEGVATLCFERAGLSEAVTRAFGAARQVH
jgi:hypothetical protein